MTDKAKFDSNLDASMKTQLHRSLRRGVGATTTETVMLLVLVAMVVVAGLKVFGGGVGQKVEFANDSVGAVSIQDNEMDRLRANQRRADAKRASQGRGAAAAPSGAAGTPQAEGAATEGSTDKKSGAPAPAQTNAAVAPTGGCGGFNPFAIPIILGLLGLLGYVVVKSRKG